jgi:hypothetical protein
VFTVFEELGFSEHDEVGFDGLDAEGHAEIGFAVVAVRFLQL